MMSRDTGGIMKPLPSCNPRRATPEACGGFVLPRGSYEPYHPFDLKPGQARNLLVEGFYRNCHVFPSSLSTINLSDFPVRFSFLWKTATARIPLPKERMIIPPNRGCKAALAQHKSRRLIAPQRVVYGAGTIKIGAEVVCLRRGASAGALVPKRGQSVVGIADGRFGGATIRLTTRADGSIVARCG